MSDLGTHTIYISHSDGQPRVWGCYLTLEEARAAYYACLTPVSAAGRVLAPGTAIELRSGDDVLLRGVAP
jgi:hypothetical protein